MLSVVIITKNEEANIARCLASVSFAEEIIVLDSGSTDRTVAIAKEFTPHVYINEDWRGYGIQKQRALALATQDWVLNLDADESVSEKLRNLIKKVIKENKADGYRVPIRMNFSGKPLRYSSSPSRHIRLFKRQGARYSHDIVHEKIVLPPNSLIKKIRTPIEHESFQDISHALTKMNKYSSYSAKIRLTKKKPPSFPSVLLSTSWMFLRCFGLQLGFLDGKAGFLMAMLNAQGTFYRGMKQIYQDKQLDSIPETREHSHG